MHRARTRRTHRARAPRPALLAPRIGHRGPVRHRPDLACRHAVLVDQDLASALGDRHDQVGPLEHCVFQRPQPGGLGRRQVRTPGPVRHLVRRQAVHLEDQMGADRVGRASGEPGDP